MPSDLGNPYIQSATAYIHTYVRIYTLGVVKYTPYWSINIRGPVEGHSELSVLRLFKNYNNSISQVISTWSWRGEKYAQSIPEKVSERLV